MQLKQRILVIFAIMGFCFVSHSQVGVGTLSPANSAQLDITSVNKGLLIPRISLTGTTNQNPVTGAVINSLLVYNTATVNDVSPGFYYWEVNKWVRIMAQSDPEILTSLNYDVVNNRLIYLDEKGITNVLQLKEQAGPEGPQGPIGLTGPAGPQGIPGNDGATGPAGPQGPIGLTGDTGPQGIQGVPGNDGAIGPQGPQGDSGVAGPAGPQGPIGLTGPTGPQGIPGNDGAIGPQGPQGIQGESGVAGPQGPIGLTGPAGPQGIPGNDGATGPAGPQGPIGLTGGTGPQGPQGPIGPQGGVGLIIDGTNTTVAGSGTQVDPYQINTPFPATTVSNASLNNTFSTTVNGVTSSGAPIVNSYETSLTGSSLITTVNGVPSTALDLTPAIAAGQITTNLGQAVGSGIITYTNEQGTAQTALLRSSDPGNIITIGTDGGALLTAADIPAVTSVSNASTVNTSTVTVNGVVSSGAPIVNTNETSIIGTNLITSVNNVASTPLDLTPLLVFGTTNYLETINGNLLSIVNGVPSIPTSVLISATNGLNSTDGRVGLGGALNTPTVISTSPTNTLAIAGLQSGIPSDNIVVVNPSGVLRTISPTSIGVNSVSNNSTGNNLTTTVNGLVGPPVTIINSNAASLSGANLTTTVNGVNSNVLDLAPAIVAATTNTLTVTNGNLVSTVNGVATTPAVPVLVTANNGLTASGGNVQLGGPLLNRTVITTDPTNTLAIEGLPNGFGNEDIVVSDSDGTLKRIPNRALEIFYWSTDGNFNINPDYHFLGTWNDADLVFRRNSLISGRLAVTNTSFGVNSLPDSSGGSENVAIGSSAMLNNTTGSENIASGYFAMNSNTTGGQNTAIGNSALQGNIAGSGNTAVGYSAGSAVISGDNNTLIGASTGSADGITSATAIGAGAYVAASNSLVLGGPNTSVGIGTDSPTHTFHVRPTGGIDPIRAEGLVPGLVTDNIVVADFNGVFKTITASELVPPPVVSNTSLDNNLSTTVNGVTGTAVPIINTNELQLNGGLISIVNGVPSQPVPVLTKAANGLSSDPFGGVVELGGPLEHQTEIMTNGQPFMISGLPPGSTTDNIIVSDPGGMLRTVPRTAAFSAKTPIIIGATVTAPSKASSPENDFIRYRELGNNEIEVDFLYSALDPTGADAGSGDYLFTLPNGLIFDPNEHPVYNGVIDFDAYGMSIPFALRDVRTVTLAYATTPSMTNVTGYIIPFSPNQFRILPLAIADAVNSISFLPLIESNLVYAARFTFVRQ